MRQYLLCKINIYIFNDFCEFDAHSFVAVKCKTAFTFIGEISFLAILCHNIIVCHNI